MRPFEEILTITCCPFVHGREHWFSWEAQCYNCSNVWQVEISSLFLTLSVQTYFQLCITLTFHRLGWIKGTHANPAAPRKHPWCQPFNSARESKLLNLNCNQGGHSPLLPTGIWLHTIIHLSVWVAHPNWLDILYSEVVSRKRSSNLWLGNNKSSEI